MTEKYGEEQVSLLRTYVSCFGLSKPLTRASVSVERILTCFGIILSTSIEHAILRVGPEHRQYPDDKFGTVTGYIQSWLGVMLRKIRPNTSMVFSPLIHIKKGIDYKGALDSFAKEEFDEKVYPHLSEEERKCYDDANNIEYPEEKEVTLWGFLSDLFIQFRAGRTLPPSYQLTEPQEFNTFPNFMLGYVDDSPDYSKPLKAVGDKILKAKKILDVESVNYVQQAFGDVTYFFFGLSGPPDIFTLIGSSSVDVDLSWVKFKNGKVLNPKPETNNAPKPPAPVSNLPASAVKLAVDGEKLVVQHTDLMGRFEDAQKDFRRVNQVGEDKQCETKFGGYKQKRFFEEVMSKNAQRKVISYVKEGPLVENVERLVEFFKSFGETELEEDEFVELAIRRLSTFNQVKYDGKAGTLKK